MATKGTDDPGLSDSDLGEAAYRTGIILEHEPTTDALVLDLGAWLGERARQQIDAGRWDLIDDTWRVVTDHAAVVPAEVASAWLERTTRNPTDLAALTEALATDLTTGPS